MADAILRIKTVMDVGDVVSNVGTIQKALGKLKLPDNLKDNLNKNIGSFYKEYEKYQKKLGDGLKTQGDFNQVEKSLNRMRALYSEIGKDAAKAIKIDPEALFNLDEGKFKNIANKIEQTLQKLSNLKVDKKPFEDAKKEIESLSKNQKIVGNEGILTRMMGHIETGEIGKARQEYTNLINEVKKAAPVFDEMGNRISKPGTFNVAHYQQLQSILSKLGTSFSKAGADAKPLEEELNRLQQEMAETVAAASKDLVGNVGDYNKQAASVEKVTDSLKRMHEEEYNFNRQAQDIDRQIQSYFGLSQMIRKVGEIARDAFNTVKELDAAMVETAVVTNFSVGDMWDMLPTYTANANQLGSTIKDVYEAATLYYQQGLNQAQSMGLANETLKMARIGGLQAADATNMMTAALRGFNMEINQVSAKRINDVYSELAAITAADTKEIGSAMERTASIANSANMQFETTSAFLAQMIETTREAPENLGTAMKTIIARFQEMKQDPTKLVDSEGVALDANKIDTALKTIGVDLKNQKGEFRDLDTVFLEISEKWDSLTQGQQRYIATIAAGSRQQSRFIAMMQNYERVKELVDAANNSAGASQKQFEKTLDSMSSKLNRLKNAWDQFTMGLMNNQILKGGVDALTGFFTVVNKIFDVLTKPFPDPFGGLIKSALTLTSTLALLNLGKKGARGAVMAGVGWWKGEGNIAQNFASGWGGANAAKAGTTDGKIYAENFNKAIKNGHFKEAFNLTKQQAQKASENNKQYENTFAAAFGQDPKVLSSAIQAQGLEGPLAKEIEGVFARACAQVDTSKYATEEAQEFAQTLQAQIANGKISAEQAAESFRLAYGVDVGNMGVNEIEKATTSFGKLSSSIQNTGVNLQAFGMALQNTPLAPLGSIITTLGSALMSLGGVVGKVAAVWTAGITTATGATLTGTAAMRAGFKALFAEIWAFFTTNPVGWLILAIAGVVAAVKGIDAIYESNAEKLEKASDGAAKASEAFDSAKQETSELNDAISRIRENESAFDNLVAGTADFNEQMVTANEQITELLQKYPMLNDYVSTDKNGLMHISEEGLEAVKNYQKQIQARASATNIIQSADLAAIENQQKAEKLRKKSFRLTEEEIKKNKEDAQLLDERAKAEVELARRNAARTILNGKEIKDVEAMSAIYANLYEEKRKVAEAEVSGMSKKDIAQQYADYHGYTYNKSTNKMKDTEGNEVDFDDKVIKDEVIENTVLLDFEANAESLDSILTNLDNKFSETLGNVYKDSDNFVSDLLSSNIETNTDLLKDVLSDSSTQLSDLVHSMSDEELAAILGVTQSEVSNNLDTYQKQAIDLLTTRANSIVEAQSQSYAKLGEMMARASDVGFAAASTNTIQSSISKQIAELSTQQANTLSTIGQTLEQNVGPEAMETFIREASSIYLQKDEELSKEFDSILNDINWESPTSRLEGYHNAINSTNEDIQNWGKSMRASADEANILGDAFTEFLSKDWEELSQNADNFKNSMGEIDNAGIMAAAKESKTLKSLLDSGEVSATGLAKALQAVEDGSLSEVNSTVLELLSSMNRLGDAALEAHEIVSNFDAGIDFGEGEDFVKENAEKAKEYFDNGEWGNQQLQNYIKLAAGTEKWDATLRSHKGNLQETTDELMKYVTTFKDGFQPAWDQMISGKNINGKSLSGAIDDAVKHFDTTGVSKELGDKFKEVSVSWDNEGFMQIDVGDLTTQELETYFQEIYGVSKEYAQLLMQDLANYDGEVSAALAKNDLQATIGDQDFQSRHLDREGNLTFSNADLQAFEAAGGSIKELEQAAGKTVKTFEVVDEEGNRLKVNTEKLQEFDKVFGTGKGRIDSLITDASLQGAGGKLDLSKLIDVTKTKAGFDEQQSLDAAYRAYQRASNLGESTLYDGVELEKGLDREGWEAAIAEATETSKWVPIGEAIAQGFMNVINGNNTSQNAGNTLKGTISDDEYTGLANRTKAAEATLNDFLAQGDKGIEKANQFRDAFVDANINGLAKLDSSQLASIADQLGLTEEQLQRIDAASEIDVNADTSDAVAGAEETENAYQQVNSDISSNPIEPEVNSEKAEGDIEIVKSDWEKAVESGRTNPMVLTTKTDTNNTQANTPQETKSTYTVDVKGQEKVDNVQTKLQELNAIVNKGGSYNLNVTGVTKIQKAAKAASSLSNSKDSKTISVKTGKADTSSVARAKAAINKTEAKIKVGAETSKALSAAESARKKIDSKSATINVSTSVKGKNVDIYVTKHVKEVTSHTGGYITPSGVLYRAKGGNIIVPSFKKKGTDTVPAMLTPGEYVQNRDAVNYFGIDFMRKINHKDLSGALQAFGSAAKGRYGRVGPKDKGGLTLTGEKGFEIAWLPSENRSMVLGVKGPQMINLPRDAVVYTHEQSKKIIKQKSIPAGSHANERTGRRRSGSGGSGGSGKTKKKSNSSSSTSHKTISSGNKEQTREVIKAGKVYSYIFNLEQKIAQVKLQQEAAQKKLNKQLEIAYNTLKGIKSYGDKDINRLNKSISLNKKLRDYYKGKLKDVNSSGSSSKTTIEWTNPTQKRTKKKGKWGSWKSSSDKKHSTSINLGNYIYYDSDTGAYQVDYEKITKNIGQTHKNSKGKTVKGDKNKAKAVKEAAEKAISEYTSKRDSAIAAIEETQEKLDELGKQLYEQFYGWENELTKILSITTQIAEIEKRTNRIKEGESLQEAIVAAGYKAIGDSLDYYKAELISLTSGLDKRETLIEEQKKTIVKAISISDEWNRYVAVRDEYNTYDHKEINSTEEATLKARKEALYEEYRIAKEAQKYIISNINSDGTISTSIYSQDLEDAHNTGKISKEMYEGIKKYYDNLTEQNDKLNELYENQISDLRELYETVKDLKEQYADRSEELLDSVEKAQEEEVKKLEKLNDALTNAFKDLLDEVKSRLDQRRQQEDNKKKEEDIANKQRRLAALQADTSGGHAVEIKQLQKEIADAQQSYSRELEDQRLNELQKQADEAQKQRERQIQLLSAQLDQDKENGNNLALVNQYLADPSRYESEIQAIWKANKEYDQQTDQRKVVLDDEWEVFWSDINGGLSDKIDITTAAIDSTKETLDNIESSLNSIVDNINNNTSKYNPTDSDAIINAMNGGLNLRAAINDMRSNGATDEDIKAALKEKYENNETIAQKLKEADYGIDTALKWTDDLTYKEARGSEGKGYSTNTLKESSKFSKQAKEEIYKEKIKSVAKDKKISKSELLAVEKIANEAGHYRRTWITDLANTKELTWKQVITAAKAAGFSKYNMALTFNDSYFKSAYNSIYGKGAYDKDKAYAKKYPKKYKAYSYSTGGIADYTGPAWLHGTPSKPELVLNATDTKNFLALKDVLSKAMTSTSSIENSYGGDMNFEVNINVDHLNNDYDVDKVADRVRKIIVKDAGYRNVTQVRNFR